MFQSHSFLFSSRLWAKGLSFLSILTFATVLLISSQNQALAARYASLVIDGESGEVLHSVNPDSRVYPASLTKMMTLFMAFDELSSGRMKLNDRLQVSSHASVQSPSKLGLRPGQTIELEDAILALVTKSANDAAVVIAESIGGSEEQFGVLMTRRAREIGMSRSNFENASGLPNPGQVTTARDMAILARALIRHHGEYYHYFSTRQFRWGNASITTHNRLMLNYPGADGIKTGYIGASGFNLVASAKRDGRRLIGVVFGGRSAAARDRHMAGLLDKGFATQPGNAVTLANLPETVGDGPDEMPTAAAAPREKKVASDSRAIARALARVKAADNQKAVAATPKLDKKGKSAKVAEGDADIAGWGIQIGAYSQKARAVAAAAAAQKQLGGKGQTDVSPYRNGNNVLFRARLAGLSEAQARDACKKLGKSMSCKVVGS